MKAPLAKIKEFLPKNQFDASDLSLNVCREILSTHTQCDWTLLNPIRKREAELVNESLVEDLDNELLNKRLVAICPSDIVTGMLINNNGYIGKVVDVKRFEAKENMLEPYVYVVYLEYVCGDLNMHKYFTSRINNGTSQGYLSTQQGNRKATFFAIDMTL